MTLNGADFGTFSKGRFNYYGGSAVNEFRRLQGLPDAEINTQTTDPVSNFEVFWHTFEEQCALFDIVDVNWHLIYDEYRGRVSTTITEGELFSIMEDLSSGRDRFIEAARGSMADFFRSTRNHESVKDRLMAIPTSRTKVQADIAIDEEKCTGCGLCVSVCKDFSLKIEHKKVRTSGNPFFGCIGCGHCMAICPSGAIRISGRTLSPDDLFDLPDKEKTATYDQLLFLLQRRRSIREFSDRPVERGMVLEILKAAQTAPMGLPPSDVNVLILDSKEKTRRFAKDFCTYLEGMKWLVSDWFITLMRPFWGKANDELFRGFVKPLFHIYTENMKQGINLVNYDAPLAMYFYGSPYSDPADPIIAATYAMLAGEALGLGTCMLGGVHPLIQKGKKAARFRDVQGIRHASQEGVFVIFGHPLVHYRKGISRTFASIDVKGAS